MLTPFSPEVAVERVEQLRREAEARRLSKSAGLDRPRGRVRLGRWLVAVGLTVSGETAVGAELLGRKAV